MAKKNIKSKSPLLRFIIYFWIGMLGISVFIALLFVGISWGMLGKLPDIQQLENPETFQASEVYTEDSVLLGKYYYENRSNGFPHEQRRFKYHKK